MSTTIWPRPTHDSLKAKAARALHPAHGYCGRCGMPWNKVREHVTYYRNHKGCFVLCEPCWTLLGHPEARIEYYAMLIDYQDLLGNPISPDDRQAMGRAVAAGW